ncbi:MAG: hypothetical protein KC457_04990, partial [Myxococcales bacterium]|nr:hypothetical protein [Myxococcales bacterium]
MDKLIAKLPAFALPFVTRSLRGGRGRRYLVFSLVLAGLTMMIGLWIALGRGDFEHQIRVDTGLEHAEHMREQEEFVLFSNEDIYGWDADELREVVADAGPLVEFEHQTYYFADDGIYELPYPQRRVLELRRNAYFLVQEASRTTTRTPEQRVLQQRARALIDSNEEIGRYWYD